MKHIFTLTFWFLTQLTFGQTSKRIDFHPTVYYRSFSATAAPALKFLPGDTIHSESIDAGGFDRNGKKVSEGGNPLTGPFYIEGLSEGDVLAVTLIKVYLNRDYASTFELFVPRSLPKDIVNQLWRKTNPVDWYLDLNNGLASPKVTHEHLKDFKVPVSPFLGCVGVAPKGKEIRTFDSGPFGGNLDFSRITGSSTIYLPVFNTGGLLYMGDGHAIQGDGELTGSALETSMEFDFTVRVIKKGELELSFPRIEDQVYIMAVGLDKDLDKALKFATKNLLAWIQRDYQLSLKEATQVLGPLIEYRVAEIADPKVEVVAMIKKEMIKRLKRNTTNK